jgi:hypothetical protein
MPQTSSALPKLTTQKQCANNRSRHNYHVQENYTCEHYYLVNRLPTHAKQETNGVIVKAVTAIDLAQSLLGRLQRFKTNYAKLARLKFFIFKIADELLKHQQTSGSPQGTVMACAVTARKVREIEEWADEHCDLRSRGFFERLVVTDRTGQMQDIGRELVQALDALSGAMAVAASALSIAQRLRQVFETKHADREVVSLVWRAIDTLQRFASSPYCTNALQATFAAIKVQDNLRELYAWANQQPADQWFIDRVRDFSDSASIDELKQETDDALDTLRGVGSIVPSTIELANALMRRFADMPDIRKSEDRPDLIVQSVVDGLQRFAAVGGASRTPETVLACIQTIRNNLRELEVGAYKQAGKQGRVTGLLKRFNPLGGERNRARTLSAIQKDTNEALETLTGQVADAVTQALSLANSLSIRLGSLDGSYENRAALVQLVKKTTDALSQLSRGAPPQMSPEIILACLIPIRSNLEEILVDKNCKLKKSGLFKKLTATIESKLESNTSKSLAKIEAEINMGIETVVSDFDTAVNSTFALAQALVQQLKAPKAHAKLVLRLYFIVYIVFSALQEYQTRRRNPSKTDFVCIITIKNHLRKVEMWAGKQSASGKSCAEEMEECAATTEEEMCQAITTLTGHSPAAVQVTLEFVGALVQRFERLGHTHETVGRLEVGVQFVIDELQKLKENPPSPAARPPQSVIADIKTLKSDLRALGAWADRQQAAGAYDATDCPAGQVETIEASIRNHLFALTCP